LGRGFDSLIPQNFDDSLLTGDGEKVAQIAIGSLLANPEQPRLIFDEEELAGLTASVKQHGILQPLVVTPHQDKYYIIAGERRWRAAKKAGLKTVPAIVRSAEQLERLELALVENVQRVNLSPLEQAASIEYLRDQFSLDYAAIGKRLGKAATTVQNTARLMQLTERSKQALRDKQITEGHARAILGLKDSKAQEQLLKQIVQHGWSVRQAERYVVAQRQGATTAATARAKVATSTAQTKRLAKVLNTKVSIRRTAKGGKLEIGFTDDNDLKRITELLDKLG
jgi:ParB family chromosome partitioning protein